MNIFLRQKVKLKYDGEDVISTNIAKDICDDFVPRKGDFICDPLYKDTGFMGEVERVVINYSEDACYIDMKQLTVDIKYLMIDMALFTSKNDKKSIMKFWVDVCKSFEWYNQIERFYTDEVECFTVCTP